MRVVGATPTTGQSVNLQRYTNDWHINAVWRGDVKRRTYAWVFNSHHPGGAQFVNCDGSVKVLPETMDYLTFCRLNYIQDGDSVDFPD